MDKGVWFILEVETGLIDGWYRSGNIDKEGIKEHWDRKRPGYTHIICRTSSKICYLQDEKCLNRA